MTVYGTSMMKALEKRMSKAARRLEKKYGCSWSDFNPRNIVMRKWCDWKAKQKTF